MARGKRRYELPKLCSRGCGRERRRGQRECNVCHAATMRAYRQRSANEIANLKRELARLRAENEALRQEAGV
jgi:50S ribosomal subunit-associated GTPase HflX